MVFVRRVYIAILLRLTVPYTMHCSKISSCRGGSGLYPTALAHLLDLCPEIARDLKQPVLFWIGVLNLVVLYACEAQKGYSVVLWSSQGDGEVRPGS